MKDSTKTTISMPVTLMDWAQAQAREFSTFSAYIQHLVREDLRTKRGDDVQSPPNGNGAAKAADAVADINAGLVFKLPGGTIEYTMTRGPHPREFPDDDDHSQLMEAAEIWEAWRMDIEMARANSAANAEAEEDREE